MYKSDYRKTITDIYWKGLRYYCMFIVGQCGSGPEKYKEVWCYYFDSQMISEDSYVTDCYKQNLLDDNKIKVYKKCHEWVL